MNPIAAILEGSLKSKINDVSRSQPVCTAIQIAIAQLLREWGIMPQAVAGHSSGDYPPYVHTSCKAKYLMCR